jgi:hypothetical protein
VLEDMGYGNFSSTLLCHSNLSFYSVVIPRSVRNDNPWGDDVIASPAPAPRPSGLRPVPATPVGEDASRSVPETPCTPAELPEDETKRRGEKKHKKHTKKHRPSPPDENVAALASPAPATVAVADMPIQTPPEKENSPTYLLKGFARPAAPSSPLRRPLGVSTLTDSGKLLASN